jgi:hypothetical protein
MQYEDFLSLVKEHRTLRRFKPDSIPDNYVDRIIEISFSARWALIFPITLS